MDADNRRTPRYEVHLPVEVAGQAATTRDMSVSGVYFETDGSLTVGSEIDFAISLKVNEGAPTVRMSCHGKVVRIDRRDEKTGVAAMIESVWFDAV